MRTRLSFKRLAKAFDGTHVVINELMLSVESKCSSLHLSLGQKYAFEDDVLWKADLDKISLHDAQNMPCEDVTCWTLPSNINSSMSGYMKQDYRAWPGILNLKQAE